MFLDRDGIITRPILKSGRPHPPPSADAMEILPDVSSALAALRGLGFPLIVVTNQPDVARGRISQQAVEAMHDRLNRALNFDAILTCFHDGDECDCRKPKPGLLLRAAQELGIELRSSFIIGDRWRDIEAGRRAGCGTFFVDYGYAEERPRSPDYRVHSLRQAADIIVALNV